MVNLGRKGKGRHSEMDFYKKGWPEVLISSEAMLYLAIRPIEKLQNKSPGQTIVANWNIFAKYSGVNKGFMGKCFERLQQVGLIKYRKGLPFRWKLQATEVERIIPIPNPDSGLRRRHLGR
jgi:hypothetical protein